MSTLGYLNGHFIFPWSLQNGQNPIYSKFKMLWRRGQICEFSEFSGWRAEKGGSRDSGV